MSRFANKENQNGKRKGLRDDEKGRGYSAFCLFSDCSRHGDFVRGSYIVELKDSKADASEADLAAKAAEGIALLGRYAVDPPVPVLSAGMRLHCILYQFKGADLIRFEEIAP